MYFERTKAFERRFNFIRINENDIARIANIITKYAKNGDSKIDIVVKSSDGKEVYKSDDSGFFLCDDMPREIRFISIKYFNLEESLECTLIFDTRWNKPVELNVSGSEPGVPGLFLDLEKALISKQIFGYKILDIADRFWFGFGLSLLLASVIYFVFDIWLDFLVNTLPNFEGSTTHITIGGIGWSAIIVTIMTGLTWIEHAIKKLFSPIQFSGQISDPSAKARKIRFWVFAVVLIPLTISVMPNVAFILFDLVFDINHR